MTAQGSAGSPEAYVMDLVLAKMKTYSLGVFAELGIADLIGDSPKSVEELAQSTLKTLNEKSPRGMVVTLKLLRLARASSSLEECLVREYRAALEVFASDDFAEGVRAFQEKRPPRWPSLDE